ncbi:MAG: hypothetical protein RL490_2653 [Pseudomonadota bacterium]
MMKAERRSASGRLLRALGLLLPLLLLPAAARLSKIDVEAFYPEGPTVIDGGVYWAEMTEDRVRRYRDGKVVTVWQQPGCGPTAVRPTPSGEIWILCHLADQVMLLGPDWRTRQVYTNDSDGHRLSRPNDGKVDRDGTLYFSSSGEFSVDAPSTGYVVALARDGRAHRVAGPYHYTNGTTVSADGTRLFVSEHLARRVWELRLQAGKLVSQKVFFDFAAAGLDRPLFREAGPDGQWLSPAGELFVAEYGGGRIIRIGPDGSLRGVLKVKTPYVTNMVASPVHPGWLVVTGTYDIYEAKSRGSVFEIPIP